MAKKKATMTLKDFHGGSIPSDLPLPSAPGVTVRPMDRPAFDRPNPWANPMGRSNHPLRPGSAGSVRNNFDDKTPFLGPNTHIGRNFDEDERKPLDGGSGPRRTVSDDSIRALPTRADVAKPNYPASYTRPPTQQFSSASPISYASRVNEAPQGGTVGPGPYPNVWGVRKEVMSVGEVAPVPRSGPDAVAKLAHASALDKVSSGRWQSNKHQIHQPLNVEPIKHGEVERSYHSANVAGGMEYQDAILVRHVERNLNINDGIQGAAKDISSHEKVRPPMYHDKIETISQSSKVVGSVTSPPAPLGQPERPKLKLLPRSKPLDSSEPFIDHNQGYQQPQNYVTVHKATESYEAAKVTKPVLTVADTGDLAVERPKLNLKPRTQALEQAEAAKKGRNSVFGGARPRELVLKERGVDDIVVNNHAVQSPNRVKQDHPLTEIAPSRVTHSRYIGKPEGVPLDNRTRKNNVERTDIQKKNWHGDNQRNFREAGIKHPPHHQQQPQERPPSPETWRKPVEEPRPASSDGTGRRYGKVASAVELAQAFSKSVSDPKLVDRFSNQRGIPRPGQIPFSRLTDPASRAQINGY